MPNRKPYKLTEAADDPALMSGWGAALNPRQQAFVGGVEAMQDNASSVTYATFSKHCDGLDEWAKDHGYDTGSERGGLRLKNDWAVRFNKSKYNGKPCYYMVWSGYEYIWTKE